MAHPIASSLKEMKTIVAFLERAQKHGLEIPDNL